MRRLWGTLRDNDPNDIFGYLNVRVRVLCICGARVYHGPIPQVVDWHCRCGRSWTYAGTRALWLEAIDRDRVIQLPAPPPQPLPPDHPIARLRDQSVRLPPAP